MQSRRNDLPAPHVATPLFNAPAAHTAFRDLAAMRDCARTVIRSWDRDRGRDFEMKREFMHGTGPAIWSYATHSVELMRAVIDASEQDRMLVALPQIRLMIELAMTSIWLYLNPDDAARALVHEGFRQKRATIRDAVEAGHDELEDLIATAEAEQAEFKADASPAGQYFEKRCRAIEGGLQIYALYRMFSQSSHATMSLIDAYLVDVPRTEENPLGIVLNSDAKHDSHEASLGIAMCMMLSALKACDLIDAEGRHRTQIRRAAKKMGIGLEFKLVESS